MSLFKNEKQALQGLADKITALTTEIASLKGEKSALGEHSKLHEEVQTLKSAKQKLELDLEKLKEDHSRERREIDHKLGLHKKQIESERKIMQDEAEAERLRSVEEAKLAVREENLEAERKRFEKEIEFRTKRFEEEAETLKHLTTQILNRLPTVNVERRIVEKEERKELTA